MEKQINLTYEDITKVFEQLEKNKPIKMPDIKCGEIFIQSLIDNCSEVIIKDVPFASAIIDHTLFGMKIILDETLPSNVAIIGNKFIRIV